jgi:hypothetical protein
VTSGGILLILAVLLAASPRRQRRQALFSGAVAIPMSLLEWLYVPDYWNPSRFAVAFGVGVEDVLFNFGVGGISWLAATWPVRDRLVLDIRVRRMLSRTAIGFPLGLGPLLLLPCLGVGVSSAMVCSIAFFALSLLLLERTMWRVALTGAIGFALFYALTMAVAFRALPGFLSQWSHASLWGHRVCGVPLDEVAWALVYGAAWPTAVGFVFQARLSHSHLVPSRVARRVGEASPDT